MILNLSLGLVHLLGVQWCGADDLGQRFMAGIQDDDTINQILQQVTAVVEGKRRSLTCIY